MAATLIFWLGSIPAAEMLNKLPSPLIDVMVFLASYAPNRDKICREKLSVFNQHTIFLMQIVQTIAEV